MIIVEIIKNTTEMFVAFIKCYNICSMICMLQLIW